jgi:hypothetical protein
MEVTAMSRPSHRRHIPAPVAWVALAIAGLVLAAGVSLAASHLSSQHIGLSSEPLDAGQQLVPKTTPSRPAAKQHHRRKHQSSTTSTPTQITPAPVLPAPVQPTPTPVQPAPAQPAPQTQTQPHQRDDSGGADDSHSSTGSGSHGGDD